MAAPATLHADFSSPPGEHWRRLETGGGTATWTGTTLCLRNPVASARVYTDAQIDDYQGRRRRDLLWRPPLTLTVRARFGASTGEIRGTAGFGFWNDPFAIAHPGRAAPPRAIWFFYASPPSNMALDVHTPGWGWKAATLDALRPQALALLPLAPVLVPLMNVRRFYRQLWPAAQAALRISEAPVTASMADWHTYTIAWGRQRALFAVDGRPMLDCATPPAGPLGLVLWVDNQYLVATPWGRLRYGFLETEGEQWLELEAVEIS